jgi:putative transposase
MIRTHVFSCPLPKDEADALNRESGRVYTNVLVRHYRIYRKIGHWLSRGAGERVEDSLGPSTLQAHSRDAAQQGFYHACTTARIQRAQGDPDIRYPHRRKWYRTTVWKNTGIRKRGSALQLARARGRPPVCLDLPDHLAFLPPRRFSEVRLVWDEAARHYTWHLVVDDGEQPPPSTATGVAGVDLGEIHPAALTDGASAVVLSCRALRSTTQYTNKRLSELRSKQDHHKQRSRRWKRLQRRKNRFLAQQKQRERDLLHKLSHAAVVWAQDHGVGTLAIGDVRDVADGKRLKHTEQQKISQWPHGKLRGYIRYKAQAIGTTVIDTVDEHYTTQTCPRCRHRTKPKGRVYTCLACGFRCARDIVGAANILSQHLYGEVGRVMPPPQTKYRHPVLRGKRSRLDTAHVARTEGVATSREAARL